MSYATDRYWSLIEETMTNELRRRGGAVVRERSEERVRLTVRVSREPGRPPQGVAEFRSEHEEVDYTEVGISVLLDRRDVLVRARVQSARFPLLLSADFSDHEEWLGQGGSAEAELALAALVTTYIAEVMRWASTILAVYA